MSETKKVFEFRGVDNLVYAEVLTDNEESDGYTTGEVKMLSAVAEIGKTTETSSEAKYYNNMPMLVINSEGADTITLTVAALELEVLSEITGKTFNKETGALIDGERKNKYFAIGYRTKGTDNAYRYVWRLKGTFNIPDETVATESSGTDSNNQELSFTGIYTTHKFTNGGAAKGVVIDTRYDKADLSSFFSTVTTPDTIKSKTPPTPPAEETNFKSIKK